MTPCPACAEAARHPLTGSYRAACLECRARSVAQSPLYWASAQAGEMTPGYRAVLQRVFGGAWKDFHARVKHYAEIIGQQKKIDKA